jgi:hypothetical protein
VASNGVVTIGPEAFTERLAKSFSRFRATQHVTSDHLFDLDGNTARLRANMIAMHLWSPEESDPRSLQSHFVAGGVFDAIAVRTTEGWRFRRLAARVIWRTGAGVPQMATIGTARE